MTGSEATTGAGTDLIHCGTQPPVDAEGTQQLLWLVWRPRNGTEIRFLGAGRVMTNDQGTVLWTEAGIRQAARQLGYGGPTSMAFLHLANVFVQDDRPLADLGQVPSGLSHANEHQVQILSAFRGD